MSLRTFCTAIAALLVAAVSPLTQAQPPAPCAADAIKQFDFWVGTWRGSWTQDGQTKTALNVVSRSHDGCVLTEQFREEQASGLVGTSVSVWNPRSSQWQQTWVDNQASYLAFTGGIDDGVMTLSREAKGIDGKTRRQRMRFTEVTRERFVWLWESRNDDEARWSTQWRIDYTRLDVGSAPEPLAKFEALAGCWVSIAAGREYREHWMRPVGGLMMGMARSIRDGKAHSYEAMRIELDRDQVPVLVAALKGQSETRFRLKLQDAEQIVFENLKHDFPQRVTYRSTANTLDARIEGVKEDKLRGVDFRMKRIACD
jgi:Domain of unknown function (DUF6265)